jgi:plastocyanin
MPSIWRLNSSSGVRRLAAGLGAVLCLGALGAHAPAPRAGSLVIDKLVFGPAPQGLRVGDRLTWINRDIFRHSATSAGAFDIDLPAGSQQTVVLKRAGVFDYTCRYHPGMKGRIVIGR